MKFRTLAVCSLLVAIAAPAAFAADKTPGKPGKWQFSMQMEIPGMPFKMPPVKMEQCVSEQDAGTAIPRDKNSKDCKFSEPKVDGNTVTWTMDCPSQKMKGKGQMTFEEESMEGTMDIEADGQAMTMKYSGKRLGACEK